MEHDTFHAAKESLIHADEIMERAYTDRKLKMESDYDKDVDEFVRYGDFTHDEGEELKRQYHFILWGVTIELGD
jgi:hypothetical protein